MEDKNIIALVPCRSGSERIKNKNTKRFSNSSLFEIKMKQLINVQEINEIIVSTDDDKIINLCKKINCKKIKMHIREPFYASNECSNEEFISHLTTSLNLKGHLLWTHVTSPFITSKKYSEAIQAYFKNIKKYDSLISVEKISDYVWDEKFSPINYDKKGGLWPKTQDIKPIFIINSGIFLISCPLMKEKSNRVGNIPFYFECDHIESLDIDWENDFKIAEKIWSALYE